MTPLLGDYEAFAALVDDLCAMIEGEVDHVAGIDALGFILGAAMALRLRRGFVPVRKGGKLPVETESVAFTDYSGQGKSLELRRDSIPPGARVLVVDECIETGALVKAAIELIERQCGVVAGVAAINMDENGGTRAIVERYACFTVWKEK